MEHGLRERSMANLPSYLVLGSFIGLRKDVKFYGGGIDFPFVSEIDGLSVETGSLGK